MNSSNNNSISKSKSIAWKLSGLSEKLNYADSHGHDCQHDEGSSRESIQIHSQRHKRFKRLFSIQEQVLKKGIQNTVRYCRRIQSFTSKEIIATEGKTNGRVQGVFCCGSSHCPVCSEHVSRNQRNKLKKVIEYSKSNGLSTAMMTLTFSHKLKDNFAEILDKLITAKTYFMRQRKFAAINNHWHISRLEFTYGKNGFHSHFHIAMGVQDWDARNEHILKNEWIRVCQKFDISCSYDNGLDIIIDKDFKEVENYIMKSSKDFTYEIGSDGTKQAKESSVSMDYLMDIVAGVEKDNRYSIEDAKRILEIYFIGIKGRSIFSASNKFQKIYESIEDKDSEIEDVEESEERDEQQQGTTQSRIRIGRWILHYLAMTNQLHYLYDFVGHNNLTKLYDDLISVVPTRLINGIIWEDDYVEEDRIAA